MVVFLKKAGHLVKRKLCARVVRDLDVEAYLHREKLSIRLMAEMDGHKDWLVRVKKRADVVLRYVISHQDFYVREIPGRLAPSEKVDIVQSLVRQRLLVVAP